MPAASPGRKLKESDLKAGYFYYGEDLFAARAFLRDLRATLTSADGEPVALEKFQLPETRWRDILDVARTIPFFFSPWRLLVVEASSAAAEELSAADQNLLRDYFAAPTSRTVIVVLFSGRAHKSKPLLALFSSLPTSAVAIEESRPIKGNDLEKWIRETLAADGKQMTSEAVKRLVDSSGSDLELLTNELNKLVTYIGGRKGIDVEDVDLLSFGVREPANWEFIDSLEKGNIEGSLRFVKKRFQEYSWASLDLLSQLSGFFRDLLIAKSGLREKRSRDEIFAELRPQISKNWRRLYQDKSGEFFRLVETIRQDDIARLIARLEGADLTIKSSDVHPQFLLEAVILEFGRLRQSGITLSGRS